MKPVPSGTGYWWCGVCNMRVPGGSVSYDEKHTFCLNPVVLRDGEAETNSIDDTKLEDGKVIRYVMKFSVTAVADIETEDFLESFEKAKREGLKLIEHTYRRMLLVRLANAVRWKFSQRCDTDEEWLFGKHTK